MPTHKTNSIVYDDRETASKFNMSLETRITSYKQIQNKVHDSFLEKCFLNKTTVSRRKKC